MLTLIAALTLPTISPIDPATVWDRSRLYETPKTWAYQGTFKGEATPIWIEGESYRGKPTKSFAFYGVPAGASVTNKVPAIVLVHGGAGTAYPEWVRLWVRRGYAAISVDNCGQVPIQLEDRSWMASPYGGPRGWGGVEQIDEPMTDQWVYHAVAATMRAHSFLRSLDCVDTRAIGVTGISWGGFLTCILAAADERFAYAVPVYGCGFFHESLNRDPVLLAKWAVKWDACAFLPFAKIPFLWVDGTNDFAFPLDCVRRSAELTGGTSAFCTRLRMKHSHGPVGEAPAEILAFADHYARGGADVVRVSSVTCADGVVTVRFAAGGRRLVRAELLWTEDGAPVRWHERLWKMREIEGFDAKSGAVSTAVPDGTFQLTVNLIGDDGLIFSTPLVLAAAKP